MGWHTRWMSRGTRPISRIVSALRDSRSAPREQHDARKVSLMLLIGEETLRELRASGHEAAGQIGLSTEDIAYGDYVAGHISTALEKAYESSAALAEDVPARGNTVFVALRLSPAVAKKLRRDVEQEAHAQAGQHESREDFEKRRMGQRLDAAYRASASARR